MCKQPMAVDQLGMQLLGEANKSGLPLMGKQDASSLITRIITPEFFESQLKAALDSALAWFNSDRPASELVIKVNLKELKQNIGTGIPGVPDELSILEIMPSDSRQNFLSRAEEVRNYYRLAQFIRTLILGLLIVLGIFILLLTMTSMRSILRFLGGVLILGGVLAGLIVLSLPKVVSLIMAEQAPDQTESLMRAVGFLVNNLFNSALIMSIVIFAGGIILIILAQFIPRKTASKII